LLDDVRELVGQQRAALGGVSSAARSAEYDVVANGIGSSVQLVRRGSRRDVIVNAHAGEVVTEQRCHLATDTGVERATGVSERD
jgi:hypothetical protein